jgi:hypothetical protein
VIEYLCGGVLMSLFRYKLAEEVSL